MKKKIVCFALAMLVLCFAFGFTSCGSDTMKEEGATYNEPVWHISVYSPEIRGKGTYSSWRYAKYSVETNDLSTVFVQPYCECGMLTIQKSSGDVELVHMSLVEIEYY